jgi:hypothetical protein
MCDISVLCIRVSWKIYFRVRSLKDLFEELIHAKLCAKTHVFPESAEGGLCITCSLRF